MVHTSTVGRCIVHLGSGCCCLFVLFLPFSFSPIFVTLVSVTVRAKRLKLGTYMDSGQMYRVYRNQAAAAYSSLYFFIFFLSNFQTLKCFVTLFSGTVRPRKLNMVHTWTVGRCIVHLGSGCCCLFVLFLPFSFSPIFKQEL